MPYDLGRFGAFQHRSKASPALASALDEAGYGALWIGGSPGVEDLAALEALLEATSRLVVATGIVNIWKDPAEQIAAPALRLLDAYPGRFLLGIGVSHPEATGGRYAKPYAALVDYLDALDGAGIGADRRALAALGPRVLGLAGARTAAAHPYLVPVEHTRQARELLGKGVVLAPEHKAVLDPDADRARALARPAVASPYLSLVNYTSNLRRLGYTDEDLADGGSDRLVDDLVATGDPARVASLLRGHLDAGADHVAVHLLVAPEGDPTAALVDGYRRLAPELGLGR
jgi:probable F420-dependent oxidoreductase